MNREKGRNVAASVRQRLVNRAHASDEEPELVFVRYALERLLYRLSRSPYRDLFVLKGAMLFWIWDQEARRPTRDIDLLSYGDHSVTRYERIFREVCEQPVGEDGIILHAASVRGDVIKQGERYEGVRIQMMAGLGTARFPVQIDIGFGDAITPGPITAAYPTMLDLPTPELQTYPMETVVAEKFQALVALGLANSRMKDFYDLWTLSQTFPFDGESLSAAIRATFSRRETPLPDAPPVGLTDRFADDPSRVGVWRAFLRRNKLGGAVGELNEVVRDLRDFLMPPTEALRAGEPFAMLWPAGGPWREVPG